MPFLLDGVTPARDLRACVASRLSAASPVELDDLCLNVLNELVDDVVLGMCFDVHRAVKTGTFSLTEIPEKDGHASTASSSLDVFGQLITTNVGVPTLKKQPECVCPNCQRNLAASRFAPHLEKCMGMGRNSSRLASRRLATNSKESYRESGPNDDEDDAEDEDWIEPGRGGGGGASGGLGGGGGGGGGGGTSKRRQRDKNSPRRNKGSKSGSKTSGDTTPQDGSITPPSNFDQLSLEERSHWLSSICGVVSMSSSRKICTRSTKCPVHTDAQRREIRIRWLSSHASTCGALEAGGVGEETHVDIDSFTEGDTAALRESLAQLSNASSPAESVISTCSNPATVGGGILTSSSHLGRSGRREKSSRRGSKKGKSSSKGDSRGSTPPVAMD